jgi:lipopolysaccharide biosynthesis glycosyltransferase
MLNICYYSSDFYAPYTGVSMLSLLKNNSDVDIQLNCVDAGISQTNKTKMQSIASKYNKRIIFHDFALIEHHLKDELGLPICNGSYATYIKIFPEMIFPDIDRMLFIDGDTIVNGSLYKLDKLNMDNYLFAAVRVPLVYEKEAYKNIEPNNLRLQFVGIGYYNIGVFFVNLIKWRELDFGKRVMDAREKYDERMKEQKIDFQDEMYLNLAVFDYPVKNIIKELPPKYNSTVHQMPYPRGIITSMYTKYLDLKNLKESYFHPIIIHFCIFKPWFTDTLSPFRKTLKKYEQAAPWDNYYKEKRFKNIAAAIFDRLVYRMPYLWMYKTNEWILHFALRTRGRIKLLFVWIIHFILRIKKRIELRIVWLFHFMSMIKRKIRRRIDLLLIGDFKNGLSMPYFIYCRLKR